MPRRPHLVGLATVWGHFEVHLVFMMLWLGLGGAGVAVFLFPPPRRGLLVLLSVAAAASGRSARKAALLLP